ncbi:RNA polymerase sigma factor [Luethyella okanaganae]|uniref:RNA polymerase sigma factor n=1 Tax=Luethyella okanaganae TaxID=69372 RepID=A0ABW1VGM7_9MICO
MQDDSSDVALWLEAISGTEASFAALFDRYRTRVFRKAYARVRYVADAEDIVATVFLEAWRSRKKFASSKDRSSHGC